MLVQILLINSLLNCARIFPVALPLIRQGVSSTVSQTSITVSCMATWPGRSVDHMRAPNGPCLIDPPTTDPNEWSEQIKCLLSPPFIPHSIPILYLSSLSLGGGGVSGRRSSVGCLWRPVGVLLLTFQTQIAAQLKAFIDARSTWRLPHSR